MDEACNSVDSLSAGIGGSRGMVEKAEAHGVYTCECYGADGELKWTETFDNLVCTAGKNAALDQFLQNGVTSPTWYLGLISSVSYTAVAVGDTAAQINGSNGWKEANTSTNYPQVSQGTRPAVSWSAASGGSKAGSAVTFNIVTNGGTVKGAFLSSVNTFGGTTGTLYSAGTFGADKVVTPGDTLNVTYTASL